MRSRVKTLSKEEIKFPYLGYMEIVDDLVVRSVIVLFNSVKSGMVVHADFHAEFKVGDYRQDWDLSQFTDFTGTLELFN